MRVGIVTDPMDTVSSVRVYLANLIENLFRLYDPGQIYLIHRRRGGHPLYQQGREVILPGLYQASAPSASLGDLLRPLLLRQYKLDIIHYTHSHAPLTFFTSGARNVCLVTTVGPATHPQYYPLASRYLIRVARLVNRRMDAIITESQSEKKEIVSFLGISEDRVRVIPSGVDEIFKPGDNPEETKRELRDRYGVKFPFILNVGGYRPVKNGPALIRAFARLKRQGLEHRLVLVGRPGPGFGEVLRAIRQLGLDGEVITTGFVPREDLPKFYNAAALFVLPSFKESFGHVLVEAMACGCPVVTSNVTCMPEVVGEAGVLIDPYSVDSLAEGMYRVLADSGLRRQLRDKGLRRAQLFSWENCARQTLKLYQELCK